MQAEPTNEIGTRLCKLEGSMRRWRACAIIASVALGAAGILGATPSSDVTSTARRFDVVDEDGKVRVSLGADSGGCFLLFKDTDGKVRTQLTLQSDGTTGLSLKDEKAVDRLSLSLQSDGNNSLSFRGENKKATQSIGGRPDGDMLGNRVAACEAALRHR